MKSQNREGKETGDTTSEENGLKETCCCPEGLPEIMAKCCESMGEGGSENMPGMMVKCCEHMKRTCRWFPLIPVVLAGAAFLLGYYLSPATVRVLWLVFSGAVALAATIGLILANAMCRA